MPLAAALSLLLILRQNSQTGNSNSGFARSRLDCSLCAWGESCCEALHQPCDSLMSTAIDTSAEDATDGAREGQQTINADGVELEAATPQDEDAAKKAKKRRAPPLSESHLVGPHGLIRIEKDFPERLKPCVKGREREWLRQLMFLYKVRLLVTHRRRAVTHASFARLTCRQS
jgi:hypothetical protein